MRKSGTSPKFLLGALIASMICWPAALVRAVEEPDPLSYVRVDYSVGETPYDGPYAVTTGDFNGDFITDLATANSKSNTVSILLGNKSGLTGKGDGTFGAASNYGAGSGPVSITTGDFNGDFITDLATANSGSNNVSILLGNFDVVQGIKKANGTFGTAVGYLVGSSPYSVTTGDFNGDGIKDLATANSGSNNVSILLGIGNGTFVTADYSVGGSQSSPSSVTTGDFNGDGITDLATANSDIDTVSILLGNFDTVGGIKKANGEFGTAASYPVGDYPRSITTGDFNYDGKTDLAVANRGTNFIPILLGKGDGTFDAAKYYTGAAGMISVTTGDFNSDDKIDLVTANDEGSDSVSIFLGDGTGSFATPVYFNVGVWPFSVTTGDFNADGKIDLATANLYVDTVSVLMWFSLTANAGPDQVVIEPDGNPVTVTLHGSDSACSTEEQPVYEWVQVAGTPGTLSNPAISTPEFTSPPVPVGGETFTFTLVVTCVETGVISQPDSVDIKVKRVNKLPVAEAGEDQTVSENSVSVTLDGSESFDEDGDNLSFTWTQILGTPVAFTTTGAKPTFTPPSVGSAGETLAFRLIVNDGLVNSGPDDVTVTVTNVNQQPIANAGPDATVGVGTIVTLDGRKSSDPDSDTLTYLWWTDDPDPVTLTNPKTALPTFTAPQGSATLTFKLVVNDGKVDSVFDSVTIVVQDTSTPPACNLATPSVSLLWPPAHKMIEVGIANVTDPDNDHVTITVTSVTQDEPVNGLGDGDTSPDAVPLEGTGKALLRQERSGKGNGRVYKVYFTADDGLGGSCTGSVTVCVPKDAKTKTCVDDSLEYDSTLP